MALKIYTNSQIFHLKHDTLIIQVGMWMEISIPRNILRTLLNVLQLVLHAYNHPIISHMIMCMYHGALKLKTLRMILIYTYGAFWACHFFSYCIPDKVTWTRIDCHPHAHFIYKNVSFKCLFLDMEEIPQVSQVRQVIIQKDHFQLILPNHCH